MLRSLGRLLFIGRPIFSEHPPHRIRNFAKCRTSKHRINNRWHQVRTVTGYLLDPRQAFLGFLSVAFAADSCDSSTLLFFDSRIHLQDIAGRFKFGGETVEADDDPFLDSISR